MVRNYTKKVGPSMLFKYPEAQLERAVQKVRDENYSIRRAANEFDVPRTILRRKLLGIETLKHGRNPVLDEMEENILSEGLKVSAEWGFPLTPYDVRFLTKSYLDRAGKKERRFKNNMPGVEWSKSFLRRHPDLSERFSENIKRKRAEINGETVNRYFNNLEKSLAGVPPQNILNYDETNFADNPGAIKVIVKRGSRHPERIVDSSKSAISVTFCVSGSGELLSPYVVYKSQHLYDTWTENGYPGTRYNRSTSGWFDMTLFEDWFITICLPDLKKLEGDKALIGDNLASHLSLEVIRQCEENNIKFILLPPNGTHLLQPLDVSFFRPLKGFLRAELTSWKMKNRGVVTTHAFPNLLKRVMDRCKENAEKNITAGFKACGIVPLTRVEVLKKIPGYSAVSEQAVVEKRWSGTLIEKLQEERSGSTQGTRMRSKRLRVEPGASVTGVSANDVQQEGHHLSKKKSRTDKNQRQEVEDNLRIMEDEDQEIEPEILDTSDDTERLEESIEEVPNPKSDIQISDKDFILVTVKTDEGKQREKLYVGQVVTLIEGQYEVDFLRKHVGKMEFYFAFPTVPDVTNVLVKEIKKKLALKECRRGRYKFNGLPDSISVF